MEVDSLEVDNSNISKEATGVDILNSRWEAMVAILSKVMEATHSSSILNSTGSSR